MKIEQIYTGCLAQGAYYIESDGEAAIIDPLREVQPTLRKLIGEMQRLNTFSRRTFTQTLSPVTKISPQKQVLILFLGQQK